MRGARDGIFLSYARKDGEALAGKVRERLQQEAPDIPIKFDRNLLDAGDGWLDQIKNAISSVEFLVLVMTPSTMTAETVQMEWRYARQEGVCICPVMEEAQISFDGMPRWMTKVNFFDIDKEWPKLVTVLRRGCTAPRVPFMAPEVREPIVHRRDQMERLKTYLLSANRPDKAVVTLVGPGGFGKTTLAADLCHSEEIIEHFDNGILWVQLGQEPDVLRKLMGLYKALTGDRPQFDDIGDGASQLEKQLKDRDFLIVIDDVWSAEHLRPFLRGGRSCARLVTTRDAHIAQETEKLEIDRMSPAESSALLTSGLPGLDAAQTGPLSEQLGGWPLALELARATMRSWVDHEDTPKNAASTLIEALKEKGVRVLYGDRAIGAVLELSLKILSPDERHRFSQLAIFPAATAIPFAAAGTLWGQDRWDTQKTIGALAQLSLIKEDRKTATIRVHSVMREWLETSLENAPALHGKLVDGWGDPKALPDGYAWHWLTWHLAQAGRVEQLTSLLRDPAWLEAKLAATDLNSLIAEFDHCDCEEGRDAIQSALRLSAHIVGEDRTQLRTQLVGRLLNQPQAFIQELLRSASSSRGSPWFCPRTASFTQPGGPLQRTLTGHHGSVNAVATVNAAKTMAASGSDDGTTRLWDIEKGIQLREFREAEGTINSVAATPDGATLLAAGQSVTRWDLTSDAAPIPWKADGGPVRSVAIDNKAAVAVSGSSDTTLQVWDLATNSLVRTLTGHRATINEVAITHDGRQAISASDDQTVKVWNLASGLETRTLSGHDGGVNAVAIDPKGQVISASDDGTLKVWDLVTGAEVRTLRGHRGRVRAVAMTGDGEAVSGSADKTLLVWNLATGAAKSTLIDHSGGINSVAVLSRNCVVSASSDRTLKVWDLDRAARTPVPAGHGNGILGLAVTKEGNRVLSASRDGTLKVWDLTTGEEWRTLSGHEGMVKAVTATPDGAYAVSASADSTLRIWNLIDATAEPRVLEGHSGGVNAVALDGHGHRAVSASDDGTIRIWDIESASEITVLAGHDVGVNAIAIDSTGSHLLSADDQGFHRLWDLNSGSLVRSWGDRSPRVNALTWLPDGQTVVSATGDHKLRFWNAASGQETGAIVVHTAAVNAVIQPNPGRLVSASSDHRLVLWDLETRQPLATFLSDSAIRACAFSPASETLVVGEDSGHIHFLGIV